MGWNADALRSSEVFAKAILYHQYFSTSCSRKFLKEVDPIGRRLTHVAFADDMTLVSRSWLSMRRMLSTLREALAARGLALHPSKCKVQTNLASWHQRGNVPIEEDFTVEVLDSNASLVLLGTLLNLSDMTGHEIVNRIAAGWKLFWGLKRLLLNQRVSINRRLRLFDPAVVHHRRAD